MSRTLLELTDAALELDLLLDSVEDVNAPEVQELIQEMLDLATERDRKVDGYCALIREYELRAQARKDEAARLTARAKISENVANGLKARLLEAFTTLELKKLETERFTVTRATNGGKLPMEIDEANVADVYKDEVKTIVINKDLIRSDLEAGKDLSFAKLGDRGQHLRIK